MVETETPPHPVETTDSAEASIPMLETSNSWVPNPLNPIDILKYLRIRYSEKCWSLEVQ